MNVVVAGAGVAGLEFLLALRDLAGDRVDPTVVERAQELVYQPTSVVAAAGEAPIARFEIDAMLDDIGARRVSGRLEAVDAEQAEAVTSTGRVSYDTLVVACGCRFADGMPGALTFRGSASVPEFRSLMDQLASGRLEHVVFAVPRGILWHLPLYELALEAARTARANGVSAQLTIVTPEEAPLGLYGVRASEAIGQVLKEAGIEVLAGNHAVTIEPGRLTLLGERSMQADAVVMVPRLVGPSIPGLPVVDDGFVAADHDGRVHGLENVFVIGDASPFPVKQGGISTQQADAVARLVARQAGADVEPEPFEPVLRGLLLTGAVPRYLRSELAPGHGESSDIATEPLWWPPAKIAGRYLWPFLAERAEREVVHPEDADHIGVDVKLDPGSVGG